MRYAEVATIKGTLRKNSVLLLFFVSAAVVLVISIISSVIMRNDSAMIGETLQDKLKALSMAAAGMYDAEDFENFNEPEDMELPEYLEMKQELIDFVEEVNILYVYFVRYNPETEQNRFIIDNTPVNFTALSEPPIDVDPTTKEVLETQATLATGFDNYYEGWEGLTSAFSPVYNADGTPSNIFVGVDTEDSAIVQSRDNSHMMSVALLVSFIIVIAVSAVCLWLYRDMIRRAEFAAEAKDDFLSRITHEIRSPLNAIMGITAVAKKSDDPEEINSAFEKIDISSMQLLTIINDILDISNITNKRVEVTNEEFDIEKMLSNIVSYVKPVITEKEQTLNFEVEQKFPKMVICDKIKLSQIINSLLSNANKFTPKGGKIDLRIGYNENEDGTPKLHIEVQDNGIGISPEYQKSLFLYFDQADGGLSRKYGGAGLGLAIAKGFADSMGGTIKVESVEGKGATFIVDIPAGWGRSLSEETGDADLDIPADWKDKKVLIVEDIRINREILISLLSGTGLNCITAENGQEALEVFRNEGESIDLVLMDVQMPVVDGLTATREIRDMNNAHAKRIPIIALTANAYAEDEQKSLEAGMNAHIAKPFHYEALINELKKYLQ